MLFPMSRKGNCWDTAPGESWFGRFKNERVDGEHFETRDEMKEMALEYTELFTTGRGCTPRWAICHRCSFWMTGSPFSNRKNW